jgi:hypothetical protein
MISVTCTMVDGGIVRPSALAVFIAPVRGFFVVPPGVALMTLSVTIHSGSLCLCVDMQLRARRIGAF